MKKQFIILVSVFAVAIFVWVSSGFSFGVYSGGCGDCHGGAADVHPSHDLGDCSACHVEAEPESPATSTCIVCHPAADPGFCPLVIGHEDSPVYDPEGASCLTCHAACDEEPGCETDADCDDGLFCNGIESCSTEGSICVDGEPPCADNETCDDELDQCIPPCDDDADCDDEDLCTTDACNEGECVNTAVDCENGVCNPADGICVDCLLDTDCAEDEICVDNVCILDNECPPDTPPEVLIYDEDGDCVLNQEELKNYQQTLKDDQKAEKNALKEKQKAEKDQYKLIKKSEFYVK